MLLDLNVSKWMHTAFGTVVASRVRSREDVLILRPFPLWLFQRGVSEGPGLLLRKLRGDIDLAAYLQTRWPTAPCRQCHAQAAQRLLLLRVAERPSQSTRRLHGLRSQQQPTRAQFSAQRQVQVRPVRATADRRVVSAGPAEAAAGRRETALPGLP